MPSESHSWMSSESDAHLSADLLVHCHNALDAKDAHRLPPDIPIWHFLRWLVGQGYLLHGASVSDLDGLHLQPRAYDQLDSSGEPTGV